MNLNFIPSSFLFLILIIVVIDLPLSLCQDDPSYTNCSRSFQCGNIQPFINYPFWGNGRAEYCGRSGFELKCQDSITQIEIMNETYRVLTINPNDEIMTIARLDLWDDVCPSRFENATLNFNQFQYSPGVVNLTLLYGCPPNMSTSQFTCPISGNNNDSVYIDPSGFINFPPGMQNQTTCSIRIEVPVLGTAAAQRLSGGAVYNLPQVLKDGFDVRYDGGDAIPCKQCTDSGGHCGFYSASNRFTCFCRNGPNQESCSNRARGGGGSKKLAKQIGAGVGAVIGAILIISAMIILCCLRGKCSSDDDQELEAFLERHGNLAQKRYNYSDVRKMTNSFKDKLGQGGYGSVFKGKLLDGRMVAVKVLSEIKGNGEDFINEVASISRTSHVNIVTLIGFCVEGPKRALIYELMPNGSLEKFIYDAKSSVEKNPHLGWETLFRISIGIARGLEYLHRGCNTRILHFDIKPHNILLDQDFCPKIADFGLAKLCLVKESIISMTGARGTAGYIAPEFLIRNFGGVSHKSDVYSYGMMLLEMVGGRKNFSEGVDNTSEIYFPDWMYKRLDLNEDLGLCGVKTMEENEIARKMILVGLWCIQINPQNRPPMSRVIEMLEGNLETLKIPPKPLLSSPPREREGSSSSWQTL